MLRLGADPDTVTIIHYAEYLAPVPASGGSAGTVWWPAATGPSCASSKCLDDSDGIVEHRARTTSS